MEDREAVDSSPDSIGKGITDTEFPFAEQGCMDCCWHCGVDFSWSLKQYG